MVSLADFNFTSKAIPLIIGIALIVLASIAILARLFTCKKSVYFISLAFIAASFVILFITDLETETYAYIDAYLISNSHWDWWTTILKEVIFRPFYLGTMTAEEAFRRVYIVIVTIPEIIQALIFLKNKK